MAVELCERLTNKPKTLRCDIPTTFDLNQLLTDYKAWCYVDIFNTKKTRSCPKHFGKDPQYIMDCIAYFLGLLQNKTVIHYNKNGSIHPSAISFPLHSLTLQKINRNFSNIKKFFEESGYIDVNHSYKTGEWSKNYRFEQKYRTHQTKKYFIDSQKIIDKSYDYYMEKKGGIIQEEEAVYSTYEVKIDSLSAYKYITEKYHKGDFNDEQYRAYYSSIYRMQHNDIYSILDDFSGRLHTNITNLKKELRQFVYFKDESEQDVIEVDIKNSQLLMLTGLLDKKIFDKIKPLITRKLYNRASDQRVLDNYITEIEDYIVDNDISNKEDIINFKNNAFNGEIYEKFVEEIKDDGYYDRLSRSKLKKVFFIWLFSPLGHKVFRKSVANQKLNDFLIRKYPNLHKYITFLRGKNDTKLIPRLLQIIESGINLTLIAEKMWYNAEKENDRVMFTTIHDSFLMPVCFRDKVVKRIKETYKEIFDIDVNLHIKKVRSGNKFDYDGNIDKLLHDKETSDNNREAKKLAEKLTLATINK